MNKIYINCLFVRIGAVIISLLSIIVFIYSVIQIIQFESQLEYLSMLFISPFLFILIFPHSISSITFLESKLLIRIFYKEKSIELKSIKSVNHARLGIYGYCVNFYFDDNTTRTISTTSKYCYESIKKYLDRKIEKHKLV